MHRQTISYRFGGGIQGVAGAIDTYLGNTPPSMSGASQMPMRYPVMGYRTARRLDVFVITNTFSGNTVLAVSRNGSPTTLTVTVPGGATGSFSAAGQVKFIDSGMDLRVTCANSGVLGRFECSATVSLD